MRLSLVILEDREDRLASLRAQVFERMRPTLRLTSLTIKRVTGQEREGASLCRHTACGREEGQPGRTAPRALWVFAERLA
jgi:hypothetical protein